MGRHPDDRGLAALVEELCSSDSLVGPHNPEQRSVVYTVETDSPTARVLPMLASWTSARQEFEVVRSLKSGVGAAC